MAIHEIDKEGDSYCLCDTIEDVMQFLEDGGWESVEEFKKDTGIEPEELVGRPFLLIHNRLYF